MSSSSAPMEPTSASTCSSMALAAPSRRKELRRSAAPTTTCGVNEVSKSSDRGNKLDKRKPRQSRSDGEWEGRKKS
ncbi:hypothetical protein BDV98DRAFT_577166, partial [Pterulicium gracile]